MISRLSIFLKRHWRLVMGLTLLGLLDIGCVPNSAAPTGSGSTAIAVEIPMVLPTSLSVSAGVVGANLSAPLNKSVSASISASYLLEQNSELTTTQDLVNDILDDNLAAVFSDSGTAVTLTSSIYKKSATYTRSDGTILYFDFSPFTFTAFSVTDPVGITPNTLTCSGNNATPPICMRVWKRTTSQTQAQATRFMEAIFTVKPTATTKGAGALHLSGVYAVQAVLFGVTYNRDSANKVFMNIFANNPSSDFVDLGGRIFVNATTDASGTLKYVNQSSLKNNYVNGSLTGDQISLTTAYFYSDGTHVRENIKNTNNVGAEEAVGQNLCVARATGIVDTTGASCTTPNLLLPAITDSYFTQAVPSDYTFQGDFSPTLSGMSNFDPNP